jgi:hypothetical protein
VLISRGGCIAFHPLSDKEWDEAECLASKHKGGLYSRVFKEQWFAGGICADDDSILNLCCDSVQTP